MKTMSEVKKTLIEFEGVIFYNTDFIEASIEHGSYSCWINIRLSYGICLATNAFESKNANSKFKELISLMK